MSVKRSGAFDRLMSAEESALRRDLAASYRLASHFGWTDLIFTHFSARLPGSSDHFLINPYGLLFDEITASNLVKVDVDGNLTGHGEYGINQAGFAIHSAIHRRHPDAHCVFHLHTVDGVAVSCMKHGLLPLSPPAMMSVGDVAYYDFGGPGQHADEGARTAQAIDGKHLAILKNHGSLAVGRTCAEAFLRIYYLERACSIQVRAQSGGPLEMPDRQVAQELGNMGRAGIAQTAALCWPALMRKVEKLDASFLE
jgi:ribulose-5-phosphate 4-epimerase/fuculose-1-phosphate aldolase